MTTARDDRAVCDALARALARDAPAWAASDGTASNRAAPSLETLPDVGLAHRHVRLCGRAALARIPKQSQMNLAPRGNLAYQAACYERASRSGHAPQLHAVLAPSVELPRGALIVEEIIGRRAALPRDAAAIMTALARIHALPLPEEEARAPILNAADPLRALLAEIEAQGRHLDAAALPRTVRGVIEAELKGLRALCARPRRPPRCLIAFDAHPGNFLVRDDGSAVLVDLEKCRYAGASLDLAHATLYTSTTWDVSCGAAPAPAEIGRAYAHWADAVGERLAASNAEWHAPLRRAMWLWSVTWCAKWRAMAPAAARADARGEDWSGELSDATLIEHVRGRVDHYLSVQGVARVQAEFNALDAAAARPSSARAAAPQPVASTPP